jgi:prepilin peptidase CpaA
MANDVLTAPNPFAATTQNKDDSLGIDRAFIVSMARIPLFGVVWVALAAVAHYIWSAAGITEISGTPVGNLGPVFVLAFGMVLAAVIDGWAFKVPNWLTLALVMSGWYVGILHEFGIQIVPGYSPEMTGGLGSALGGTALGFALLFPMLFIQGMGQGDVKMQMGFGSWVGALFGFGVGSSVILWAFCIGAIVGGIFGLVMMFARRQFGKNKENFQAILGDLHTLVTAGPSQAADRANSRRASWVRLPYGVPLCVGFLGYLWYRLILAA